ncbi:MAG TPA: cupin domain-containing protein [Acidobacteriaceae bacterium]
MKLPIVDENSVEALDLPGRHLRWLVTKETVNAQHCSMCVIQVAPGETVRPAHSHPHGEEVIYIVHGAGRVMIEGVVEPVKAGSIVLFPQGKIHMLQNNGIEEMKVACFFAPATDLENYKFYEGIEFPA